VNNTMDISSRKISILNFGISLNLPRMIFQDVVGKVILALRGIKYQDGAKSCAEASMIY
jgi:hypothetical protein